MSNVTQELRDKMYRIQGMLEAIRFPIIDGNTAYYDLIDSIALQYETIMSEINAIPGGFIEPKASCCSVHAGGYEECGRPIHNYPSTNACSEAMRKYHELED